MFRFTAKLRRPGFALPVVLLFSTLVFLLLVAETAQVQFNLSTRSVRETALRAQYAAQAGLHRSLHQLSEDSSWSPTTFTGTLQGEPSVGFEVQVLNNHGNTSTVPDPEGGIVPAGAVWLKSTGIVDGKRFTGNLGQARAIPVKPQPIFNYALYEHQKIAFHATYDRNFLDSYSGSPLGYTQVCVEGNPATYQNQAVIRSDDFVRIQGGFFDASVEFPATDAQDCDPARVSGTLTTNNSKLPVWKFRMPPSMETAASVPAPSSGLVTPGRYGNMTVPVDGAVTLQGGEYYFETIVMGDRSTLTLSGASASNPCVIYLGSRLQVDDYCQINIALEPRALQFYSTDQLAGRTEFFFNSYNRAACTIAGHGAMISLFSFNELFGAFRVFDFREGTDNRLHYDTGLRDQVLDGDPEWVLTQELRN